MQAEVILTVTDEQGRARQVPVESKRFTIGRDPNNDLVIDDPGLSRRNTLIENFEGIVQISDCGSQNGTFVNGNQVIGTAALNDGDLISIGSACDITVQISGTGDLASKSQPLDQGSQATWLSTPLIAVLAMVAILLVAGLLISVLRRDRKTTVYPPDSTDQIDSSGSGNQQGLPQSDRSGTGTVADGISGAVSIEQIEKAAVEVMHRISSDDKPYVFPENALGDIKRKVEQYRLSPALANALGSIKQHGAEIAAAARREGIESDLVIYTALAETGGGQTGRDPVETARRALPNLLSLRATFGSGLADGSLIIVAAYEMGVGTKKSHPLLATIRRVVKNPLTERNVWYLHEHGGLDAQAYDFVVSFLALGVIAQNPHQFGVATI